MSPKPQLKLTNTLTRTKQDFVPLNPENVGMYVCGITPYDDAHIGHARVYVVFDVLFRLLRHLYGEDAVKYVRNFTDIDDKIINRAAENGEEPLALANRVIASFHEDMAALNVLPPTVEPRVSTSIPGIVKMVDDLIAAGFAYVTPSGDVMYRTKKFPKFGALARRKLDEQRDGARVAVDDEKESPHDFVLWKANAKSATKMEQAFNPVDHHAQHFAAPGRPGWHIECSVMSAEHLGLPFDIHGGGEDLQFPHHCCEIAQSEALMAPGQDMARFWVHNGFITVNGEKMSKSLGNFTTIKEALKKGHSADAIRIWLLQTHYHKPVDFSDEALHAANTYHIKLKALADRTGSTDLAKKLVNGSYFNPEYSKIPQEFWNILCDDLNTKKALAFADTTEDPVARLSMYDALGIQLFPKNNPLELIDDALTDEQLILLKQRQAARTAKNWAESDRLRDELKAQGIEVEDHKDGTTTWRRI